MKKITTTLALIFAISINAQTVPSAEEVYNRIQVEPMQNAVNSIQSLPPQRMNITIQSTNTQPSYNKNNNSLTPRETIFPSRNEVIIRDGRNFNNNRILQIQRNEIIITPY